MDLEWIHYAIIFCGGAIAGSVNTLAGNGSAITLTIFTEVLGLPGNLANGTNRIGVLSQSWASTLAFKGNGKLNVQNSRHIVILACLGALAGVLTAVWINNDQFTVIYRYLMVAVFLILLVKPKRWLSSEGSSSGRSWLEYPLYLAIGFYGGFIQMGMGVFFLAILVLVSKYPMMQGNAIKTFVVAIYTIVVLAIFQWNGLVQWDLGLLMAVGQTIGGYATASWASRYKGADRVAYYLLLIIVVFALYRMFFN